MRTVRVTKMSLMKCPFDQLPIVERNIVFNYSPTELIIVWNND